METKLKLFGFSLIFLFGFFSCGQEKQNLIVDPFLPEVLTFAGDTIPLQDKDIKERLERELWINIYWQSNTVQWLKKSGKWFPLVDSILKENQVPEDFKYLIPIESGFENVTSNKGAAGFWQLMEPTAEEFGLVINEELDQRLDFQKSAVAACKLLNRGKRVLGNWTSVAASYNIGITGLKKVMDSQYTNNYYDLLINQETGRYFFRVLAAKLILTYPEKYGFGTLKTTSSYSTSSLTIDSSIYDLAYWCRQKGFSYKCFRLVNPWIKTNKITLNDSLVSISVAIPMDCKLYANEPIPVNPPLRNDSVQNEKEAIFQNLIDKKDMVGLKSATTKSIEEFHLVKEGENLSLIALKYGLTIERLFDLNPGLKKNQNKIVKGMKLNISSK